MSHSVDTLTIYEQLKSAKLSDQAAKGIANVLKSIAENDLATKTDIEHIRADIAATKVDIEKVRADIEKTIEIIVAKSKAEMIKWVACMLVAQSAIVATLVKLL